MGEAQGEVAAEAAGQEEEEDAALHQQGEVGGDAGGGRHQDGGVPWQRQRGEIRADRHEHGECSASCPGLGLGKGHERSLALGSWSLHGAAVSEAESLEY